MAFNPADIVPPGAKIKVIGIGGGGGNAVNTMIRTNIEGVEFIAANTDVQALQFSLAQTKIQVGKELTRGLGAGADPDIGRDAALEDRHAIQEAIDGANMVFITAGMGGGTGTGGAAVIAQIARELGALTVGVVTKPFAFEGKRRMRHAEIGIARLQEQVDTLITIPNQRLLQVASPDLSMIDAFRMADNVLVNAVRGISDIINIPGTVNVDFADVKTVMSSMGLALMGIGIAEGENRATEAARQAICSPLLEDVDIEGATGILINITAGEDITLMEVNQACSVVQEAAHEDCNIIFGAVIDENMGRQIRVTVIATGFPADPPLSEGQHFETKKSESSSLYQPFRTHEPMRTSARDRQPKLVNKPPIAKAQPVATQAVPLETRVESSTAPNASADLGLEELTQVTLDQLANEPPAGDKAEPMASTPVEEPHVEEFKLEGAAFDEDTNDLDFSFQQETVVSDAGEEPALLEPEPGLEQQAQNDNAERQKLDEALELADRISQQKEREVANEEDLDVPAFLRNGMKDFSLS